MELEFRAMERSLRATGCDLPLRVIPFDEKRFALPENSEWLEWDGPLSRLKELATHPCHQRYGVLTLSNYQYADTDIVFLRSPEGVLRKHSGFVATCTQWGLPKFTVSAESLVTFEQSSATWQLKAFNSGQFACEYALYAPLELVTLLHTPSLRNTLFLKDAPWDQPGFNYLVRARDPEFCNLTLPPHNMESTMAIDYAGEYRPIWDAAANPPYLIHWAGPVINEDRPINELFFEFLTAEETARWKELQQERRAKKAVAYRQSLGIVGRLKHDLKAVLKRWAPDTAKSLRRRNSQPAS